MDDTTFLLNGEPRSLAGADPAESLLRWLRRQRLTGTKEGCGDGDCGACTVALLEPAGPHWRAVNACLLPLGALPGREVWTVEGLASGDRLHPVQQALVDTAGSQCGYCTPGFVMSLAVARAEGELAGHGCDAAIEGNLCRCTGYRPIRTAAQRLAAEPVVADALVQRRQGAATPLAGARLGAFDSPPTLADALAAKAARPNAQWIAGATDLGVALSRGQRHPPGYIALDRIAELQVLEIGTDFVRIGAGVPLARLERELAGVFPALDDLLPWFAARQVKNRATLGGNLGSASPIGDLLPWLLALDAVIELAGPAGRRVVPAEDYFLAYRKTARQDEELVVAVRVLRHAGIEAGYKIAKRQADDISIVAAVYRIELDASRRVSLARLAYGGVAAMPVRARTVEDLLLGREWNADTVEAAAQALETAFTPLDDHRASAAYRRAMGGELFRRFAVERVP
jgi:xanthine dehydrogenase small subunit